MSSQREGQTYIGLIEVLLSQGNLQIHGGVGLDFLHALPALRGGGAAFVHDFGDVLVGLLGVGLVRDLLGGGELGDGEDCGEEEEEAEVEEHCGGGIWCMRMWMVEGRSD